MANRKTRRTLEAVKGKYMEATGAETAAFVMPDGEERELVVIGFDAYSGEWCFPHPLFAPDEWKQAVDEAETDTDKARAILGEAQYKKFAEAGGSGADVMLMWMDVTATMQDDLRDAQGKSGPTRS